MSDDTGLLLFGLPVSLTTSTVVTPPANNSPPVLPPIPSTVITGDDGSALTGEYGVALGLDNQMLIVEDGTIVVGANTYVSVATVRAYGAINGVDSKLPVNDDDVAKIVLNAMLWIESKEPQYKGVRYTQGYAVFDTNGIRIAQALSWPRAAAYIFGFASNGTIPPQLVNALCQLTCDITYGYEPFPNAVASQNNLQRSTIGPITKVYFNPNTISGTPTQYFPKVSAILTPLLKNTGVRSIRV